MILVTGANGAVGSYVQEVFKDERIFLTDIDNMDIRDFEIVRNTVKKLKPEIILHLAAETDVDKCEKEVDHAYKTNALGTQNIALVCQEFDILLVYISTGAVFKGEELGPYTEFDTPWPLSIYAKTKYEGEKIIQNFLRRYYIFRAGWMIGGKEKDKKFVYKIFKLCQTKKELNVVNDKFGTITYAKDMLKKIKEVVKTNYFGVYHCVNPGVVSRYEIALEVVNLLKKDIKVNAITSEFFNLAAPRQKSEALRNYKFELMGLGNLQTWKEALKEYLKEFNI